MSILWGLALTVACIIVFIAHSLSLRGGRTTLLFFFFAFLAAMIKEGPMRVGNVLTKNPSMPYEFASDAVPVVFKTLLAVAGWVFTAYLGWYLAERAARRLGEWGKRIFPVVLLSGLATASIGYAVEATALGLGWWRWTGHAAGNGFLAGAPVIVFETWMHFPTQYLLLPLFLIEYSPFRRAGWKCVFFLIPFLHSATTRLHPSSIREGAEYVALAALALLALVCPLRFDPVPRKEKAAGKRGGAELLPLAVAAGFFCLLAFLQLTKVRNAGLTVSLLPAAFFLLLAIRRVPSALIASLAFVCVFCFGALSVPALVPVGAIFLLTALSMAGQPAERGS